METFFIEQFGCRATQADGAAIERQLRTLGYIRSEAAASADVVVVNTCTVTAAADLQARQAIRTIHRDNPSARIVVTGCYAQRAPEELAGLEGVSWVVGNSHKPEIPRLIRELTPPGSETSLQGIVPLSTLKAPVRQEGLPIAGILRGNMDDQREQSFGSVEGDEAAHTRPVLKIQDGCDKRCSYCIIPQVRGGSRSLAPDRVMAEIRSLCAGGAREIVLSGIDLGSYGRDLTPRTNLVSLLRRVLEETTIERLRVSSIEPIDVTEDLLAIFSASDRMAQHFHMPMQSGSDPILKAMHRWYRSEHYARHVELVRERLPNAGIGADVIAGFPGETEEDHQRTLSLIDKLPLTYVHVFSFSARPGTEAATLQNHVSEKQITRRARELRALGEAKKTRFLRALVGGRMRVLTLNRHGEDSAGQWTRAIASNYLDVYVPGKHAANQFFDVLITEAQDQHLSCVVT